MDNEAANLVGGDRGFRVGAGVDLNTGGLRRVDLAEQRILHDFKLNGEVRRGEGERADGGGLRAYGRVIARGVVGELCELDVDVAPGVRALCRRDELGRYLTAPAERLLQHRKELFVIPAVSHHAHLLSVPVHPPDCRQCSALPALGTPSLRCTSAPATFINTEPSGNYFDATGWDRSENLQAGSVRDTRPEPGSRSPGSLVGRLPPGPKQAAAPQTTAVSLHSALPSAPIRLIFSPP